MLWRHTLYSSVGPSERSGGGSRLSRLGRRELRNRHCGPGRWRVDGDRWATHGTNNDVSGERDHAVIATRQSRKRSFESPGSITCHSATAVTSLPLSATGYAYLASSAPTRPHAFNPSPARPWI